MKLCINWKYYVEPICRNSFYYNNLDWQGSALIGTLLWILKEVSFQEDWTGVMDKFLEQWCVTTTVQESCDGQRSSLFVCLLDAAYFSMESICNLSSTFV